MKLSFFHFQFKKDRGEIASLLTLISVGLMIAGVFAGSKLAQTETKLRSFAADPNCRNEISKVYLDESNISNNTIPQDGTFKCYTEASTTLARGVLCAYSVNDNWPISCPWIETPTFDQTCIEGTNADCKKWKIGYQCKITDAGAKPGDKITIRAIRDIGSCYKDINGSKGWLTNSLVGDKTYFYKTNTGGAGGNTGNLSGCDIIDTDLGPGCRCAKPDPGVWKGHCFAGATRGTPASTKCRDDCTALNTGGGGGGGGGGGAGDGAPTGGGSCNLSNLDPDVGDCGTCIIGKSPGTKQFLIDNGFGSCADNQMSSHWCNGGTGTEGQRQCQGLFQQCRNEKACTGNPIPPPDGGTGDSNGDGGDGGDGGVGDGYPGGGEQSPVATEPKEGGVLVVNLGGEIKFLEEIENVAAVNVKPENDFLNDNVKVTYLSFYNTIPFPSSGKFVSGAVDYYLYKLPLERSDGNKNPHILLLNFALEPIDGVYTLPVEIVDIPSSGNFPSISAGAFTVCFPARTEEERNKLTGAAIAAKCKNSANTINLDLRNAPTPTPTQTPDASTFYPSINFALIDDSAPTRSYKQYELRNITAKLVLGTSNFTLFGPQNYLPEGQSTSFTANLTMKRSEQSERTLTVSFIGAVWDITDDNPINHRNIFSCELDPSDERTKIKILANTSIAAPIAYYGLELVYNTGAADASPIKCRLGNEYQIYNQSVIGSSNEAFQIAMTRWSKGEIGVLQMSAFISQLTRAPGLQITTCNPESGGCDF